MKHKTIKKHQQQATKTQKNSQKRNKTETTQKQNDENAKKYRPVICADGRPIWFPAFPSEDFPDGEKITIRYYKTK